MSAENKPDAFLLKAQSIDTLFADLGMPITTLGETVIKQHVIVDNTQIHAPKSHEQQAAEYFGKSVFPSFPGI